MKMNILVKIGEELQLKFGKKVLICSENAFFNMLNSFSSLDHLSLN